MTRPLVFPWLGSMATPAKKHYREDRMPINEKKKTPATKTAKRRKAHPFC